MKRSAFPGFTAEASLGPSTRVYSTTGSGNFVSSGGGIDPALIPQWMVDVAYKAQEVLQRNISDVCGAVGVTTGAAAASACTLAGGPAPACNAAGTAAGAAAYKSCMSAA